MTSFLTTEELVLALNHQKHTPVMEIKPSKEKKKVTLKKILKTIYWVFLGLAIIHIIYLSILFISPNGGMGLFGSTIKLAVPPNQEVVNNRLIAKPSIILVYDIEEMNQGDFIAFYDRYGENILVVEAIATINTEEQYVTTTQDGFTTSSVVPFDQIIGEYDHDASAVEMMMFVSSTTRGFISTIASYLAVFGLIYYFYIKPPKNKPIDET